jgi:hypothetical protein
MKSRAASTSIVLLFGLVPWAIEACGRGANVLEGDPSAGEYPDEAGSSGGVGGYGGKATGGFRASGGFKASGGVVSKVAPIAPPEAGGSPSAGGGPGVGEDGHDALRSSLIEDLCAIPVRFPCLTLVIDGEPAGTSEERLKECRVKTTQDHAGIIGPECWDQFYTHATCAIAQTSYCPCDGDAGGCYAAPRDHVFGSLCRTTYQELVSCLAHVASGAAGTFIWQQDESGCSIRSASSGSAVGANCSGPTGGGQTCKCVNNGVESAVWFFAAACDLAAGMVSDGRCAETQVR